ncbi:hypothetical protein C0Q70_17771 [Pomacea canaliculata]|uniref:Uncharacterized protein n=1 Tax=Pomacea canaliculata TaxID=400727 RepID=A0A2T7NLC3_POMCA|nr:hypothetical protein C0Q70_17771 [Pomacea canaliculata]
MSNVGALRGGGEPYRGTCGPGSCRFGGSNSSLTSANRRKNKISGCTTTSVQQAGQGPHIVGKRRALFTSIQAPPPEKRLKRGALITSRSSSSPISLNRYLETAHHPTDGGRYQVVYTQQYTRHVKLVQKALTGLNRRLKKKEGSEKRGVVSRWSARHSEKLFPGMCRRTYCVPPVFINTYGMREDKECSFKVGSPVFKTRVTESDLRGDNSHRMVARAFESLSRQLERQGDTCMFLISDYTYDNYFRWCRDPRQLWHECGDWFRRLQPDASLFSHGGEQDSCFSVPEDAGVQRHKTGLIVLHQDKGILLIQRLGNNVEFLLKDHLLSADTGIPESQADVTRFSRWWRQLPDKPVPLEVIKEIAGRYVGILSTPIDLLEVNERSRVRDFCDVTLLVGRLFKRLLLTDEQERITNILKTRASDKRVYLCGPPGSGKTLLLIMRARMFLCETKLHHVVVLNLYRGAKGRVIGSHIMKALCRPDDTYGHGVAVVKSRVHHVCLDLNDDVSIVQVVRQTLPSDVEMKDVLFIIDEVLPERYWQNILLALGAGLRNCHVWCAGLSSNAPKGLSGCQTSSLSLVLRCPPSVQNVLQRVDWEDQRKRAYRGDADNPNVASNGPAPLSIRHERHQGGVTVAECAKCAEELASLLQHELHLVRPQDRDPALPSDIVASVQSPVQIPCQIIVLYSVPRQQFRGSSLEMRDELELPADRFKRHVEKMSSCMFFVKLKEKLGNVTLRVVETLDDPSVEGGDNSNEILFSWVDIVQVWKKTLLSFCLETSRQKNHVLRQWKESREYSPQRQ